jgi:hypothetical protein
VAEASRFRDDRIVFFAGHLFPFVAKLPERLPPDSIPRVVHLVVLHRYPNWKLLKLPDLEFAKGIQPGESSR